MDTEFAGRDRLGETLSRLREDVKRLTPSMEELQRALEMLPCSTQLTRAERLSVIRGLERVWHIMRLLNLLSEYFGEMIVFGGGSIVNYIYMVNAGEPPRLTFDLDASWFRRVRSKRVILKEMVEFNRWLAERGEVLYIPVSLNGKTVPLFIVEYDEEKDFFHNLLSLRMPVITRYDGELFYRLLGITDYIVIKKLRGVFEETLGVRDARIDYIRFEIGLEPVGTGRPARMETIFRQEARAYITPIEEQLSYKIRFKLAKDYGADIEYNFHDLLKALLDLRLLDHVNRSKVYGLSEITEEQAKIIDKNLNAITTIGRKYFERNYHYTLVRKKQTLDQIVHRVKKKLLDIE